MIAKEGYTIVAIAVVLALVLVVIGVKMPPVGRVLTFAGAALMLGFILYFFRDPQRSAPAGAGSLLLAPADGKVVVVKEVEEPLYLKGPARQISIFLSPLDVHVNRIPADGVIEFDQYVSGDYLVAWHPKASEKNERSQLGLRHPSGLRILFKQIAGAVARRVVYHVTVGDTVKAGQRFGIVKFGSRMDVLVPRTVEVEVEVGDQVRAGETILGRLPEKVPVETASEAISQDLSS
ncbi:MAG: phosphatidylserine decarboxylase family protein [Rhodothermales bacterium]